MKKDLLKTVNPQWGGFPRSEKDITRLVLHGTGGGGTLKFMQKGGQGSQAQKIGLFHYLVERDGEVVQIMEDLEWGYHSSSGKKDRNSIGIEFLKPDAKNKTPITVQQIESGVALIKELCGKYPGIGVLQSHDYSRQIYSKKPRKPCPGTFPWIEIKDRFPGLEVGILGEER